MKRPLLTLVVALSSMTFAAAAHADGKLLKQLIANNKDLLQLPQVLAPNNGPGAPPSPGFSNGQAPVQTKQLVIDPGQPNQLAYFSPRLGARFLVQQFYLPQFGNFWGARIVSEPEFQSPLRQLGLEQGDVVTRLDGLPVLNTQELERHILDTGVRFIKAGQQHVVQGTMFIQPHRFFNDPWNPGFPMQPGLGNVAVQP